MFTSDWWGGGGGNKGGHRKGREVGIPSGAAPMPSWARYTYLMMVAISNIVIVIVSVSKTVADIVDDRLSVPVFIARTP